MVEVAQSLGDLSGIIILEVGAPSLIECGALHNKLFNSTSPLLLNGLACFQAGMLIALGLEYNLCHRGMPVNAEVATARGRSAAKSQTMASASFAVQGCRYWQLVADII